MKNTKPFTECDSCKKDPRECGVSLTDKQESCPIFIPQIPEINYIFLAAKSVEALQDLLVTAKKNEWYNILMTECEQAVAKSMKAVLFLLASTSTDKALLLGHRLLSLAKRINKILGYKAFKEEECAWLEGFYFDGRYPGDNFVIADESDAIHGVEIAKTMYATSVELVSGCDI